MTKISYKNLAHLHVIVPDLDHAADFYRSVMGFIEMQSHHNLINRGLGTYYGFEEIWDRVEISLRFLTLPEVLTIKLVKVVIKGYGGASNSAALPADMTRAYVSAGAGPISVVVEDLDATYKHFSTYAQDYSSRHRISILSPPSFLSPLLPHQVGATEHSALYGNVEVLDALARVFPQRAKFQVIDPFGVRWEFNNPID